MQFTNFEMEQHINELKPLLKHRDIVGYVAARNTRAFMNCTKEFYDFKEELIRKYGTQDKDENGKELDTYRIQDSDPQFNEFIEELKKIGEIKHEVVTMVLGYNEIVGLLTGEEILSIDWMLDDRKEASDG